MDYTGYVTLSDLSHGPLQAPSRLPSKTLSKGVCLILACSKEAYRIEREAQWISGLSQIADKMRVVYLFGQSDREPVVPAHPNVCTWIAPCGDAYEDIAMKMYHGYRFVRQLDADYVLKLDETTRLRDVSLVIDRIESEVKEHDYLALRGIGQPGEVRLDLVHFSFYHASKVSNPVFQCMPSLLLKVPYAGGPAYVLSRRAYRCLSRGSFQTHLSNEDYAVGYALHRSGISVRESAASSLLDDPTATVASNEATIPGLTLSYPAVYPAIEAALRQSAMKERTCFINVSGGLGNQLFQIATGLAYCRDHERTLRLCASPGNDRGFHWDTFLPSLRHLVYPGRVPHVTYREPVFSYRPLPLPPAEGDVGFDGYFQSSRYFPGVRSYLMTMMQFPEDARSTILAKYGNLFTENCVLVHARRGDYMNIPQFHALQGADYYAAAKAEIEKTVATPRYILISDTPAVWKEITCFGNDAVLFDESELLTVYLMTRCRHFIIANSTFSWWGAYLSGSDHVVAPRRWFGPAGPPDPQDIYESKWIVLPGAAAAAAAAAAAGRGA
jgi:hypothetical protein